MCIYSAGLHCCMLDLWGSATLFAVRACLIAIQDTTVPALQRVMAIWLLPYFGYLWITVNNVVHISWSNMCIFLLGIYLGIELLCHNTHIHTHILVIYACLVLRFCFPLVPLDDLLPTCWGFSPPCPPALISFSLISPTIFSKMPEIWAWLSIRPICSWPPQPWEFSEAFLVACLSRSTKAWLTTLQPRRWSWP